MANLSEEGLFNSVIPEVSISKITLENSGFFPDDINPHIKSEKKQFDYIQTEDSLRITLSLIIREQFDDDLYGKWFQEINLKKYLKIKIYQTLEPQILKLVSISREAVGLFSDTKFNNPEMISLRIIAKNLLGTTTDSQTRNLLRTIVTEQKVSLLDNLKIEKEVNDDGTELENVYYKTNFIIPTSQPKNLFYFCVVDFDLEGLSQDYNLKYPIADTFSRTYVEKVIENYEPVSQSFVFLEENGKIWDGPIHYVAETNSYSTGIEETEQSRPLNRIAVQNSKIQDFRNYKEIKKLKLNFEKIKKIFNRLENVSSNDYTTNINTDVFFTMNSISEDANQNCNFSFSVDLKQLAISNSKYKNFIDSYDSTLAKTVADNLRIKFLRIFRRRVKQTHHPKQKYVKFDNNEIDETLVLTAQKNDIIETIDTDFVFFEEIPTTISDEEQIKQFNLTDRTMTFITDGMYQYGLEIEIDDPFLPVLRNLIDQLVIQKSLLEEYYQESSRPSITRFFNEDLDPHTNNLFSIKNRQNNNLEGNYDPLTNSFTKSFTERMLQRNPTDGIWQTSAIIYADVMSLFIDDLNKEVLIEEIVKLISPSSGNPSGINLVISLYNTIISKLETLTSYKKSSNPQEKPSVSSKSNSSFFITHVFKDEVHNADADNTIFYNYFDSDLIPESRKKTIKRQKIVKSTRTTLSRAEIKKINKPQLKKNLNDRKGLLTLTGNIFKKTIEQETLKYFNSTNPDINEPDDLSSSRQITDVNYSFLTPTRISTKKKEINFTKNKRMQEEIQKSINVDDRFGENYRNLANNLKSSSSKEKNILKDSLNSRENMSNKVVSDLRKNEIVTSFRNLAIASRISEEVIVVNEDFETLEGTLKAFTKSIGAGHSVTIELKKEEKPKTVIRPIPEPEPPDSTKVSSGTDNKKDIVRDRGGLPKFLDSIAKEMDLIKPPRTLRGSRENSFDAIKFNNKNRKEKIKSIGRDFSSLTNEKKGAIPPQIQAEILKDKGKSSVLSPGKGFDATKQIQVKAIKEIQILTGYEKGEDGRNLLGKPKWEKLTKEVYDNLPNNKKVIAKMVDHKDLLSGKKPESIKNTKVLEETFFIQPETNKKELPKKQIVTIEKQKTSVSLEKKDLEATNKIVKEQVKFPASVAKTGLVNQQPIKKVVEDQKVQKQLEKKEVEKSLVNKKTDKTIKKKKKTNKNKQRKTKTKKN